jgi:hypothetical protein
MSEFQSYAVETAGKQWAEITFDDRLRLREIFDKRSSSNEYYLLLKYIIYLYSYQFHLINYILSPFFNLSLTFFFNFIILLFDFHGDIIFV